MSKKRAVTDDPGAGSVPERGKCQTIPRDSLGYFNRKEDIIRKCRTAMIYVLAT